MRFPSSWRTALALLAAAVVLASRPAAAAGFAIFEQGARGMGFAGAYTAQSSDPSAIFHNAAGIAFLRGKQVYFGGTLIAPSSEFLGAGPFPGEGVLEKQDIGLLKIPSVYYSQKLGSSAAFGVGVHVPFGLKTQWENPDQFTGRYISTQAELKGVAINPTLAIQLADRFAVGAGVDVRLSSVALQQRIPSVNPFTQKVVDVAAVDLESKTKTAVGFNLGILAKPSEEWSVGIAYRHKVKIEYTGTAAFNLLDTGSSELDTLVARTLPSSPVPVTTSIEFPAILSGGVAYTRDDWVIEADVNWYQWSTFASLPVDLEGRPDLSRVVPESYKNSMQYRIGVERRLTEYFLIRGGYFFDRTPSPPESMSPLLPDADRHGFALGTTWTSGRFRLDAAAWYVRSPDRATEGLSRDRYDGTYKSSSATLGISLGYSF